MDLIRLIISNERIINSKNTNLKLSTNESHYINKVMRIKIGKEIFVTNGLGSLWKGIKVDNNYIKIDNLDKPYSFQEKDTFLLGIAVVVPKNGFEDILKMCTEIGIDLIQPLQSERQANKNLNFSKKLLRWDLIINEAVEQSERLWKPILLEGSEITDWLIRRNEKDTITISITRDENCEKLYHFLKKQQKVFCRKGGVFWNVIGPEGGWSLAELEFFRKKEITFVKLLDNILRTSTASINASSLLSQWRNDIKLNK